MEAPYLPVDATPRSHASMKAPPPAMTPLQPGNRTSHPLAQSSVYQVQVSPGLRVELLPRGKGDSTVRLAQNHGELKMGMYVIAAVQGRTRISFYKLPESVVRKELDRLQASGLEYSLVLTNSSPQATPSASMLQQQQHLMTPSVYATPSVPSSGVKGGVNAAAANNNHFTASTTHGGGGADLLKSTQARQYVDEYENDELEGEEDANDDYQDVESVGLGSQSALRSNFPTTTSIDKAFLESVERLRSQRRAVEAIKRESQQKSLKIESMTSELRQVQQQLAEMREAYESLRRTAATTDTLEEALAQERNRNLKLEKDFEKLRADTKQAESNMASELSRARAEREEERVALQNALEESRLLYSEAQARIDELKKSLIQSNQERDASEAREEQTRRAFERAAAEQKERDVKAEHAMERVRIERDKAARKADELESLLAIARGQLTAQREAADASKERISVLERTVNELEENCRDLRAQLSEGDSRQSLKMREYESEIERLRREIDSILEVKEESRKAREELRAALDEEIRAHRASREELVAMEAAKREADEACERALRHARTMNERVTEISHQKDALHERLVRALAKGNALADELEEERRAAKALAETRLELLSQFVEEERRLDGTLMLASNAPPPAVQRRRAERKLEFPSPSKPQQSSFSRSRNIAETPDTIRSVRGMKQ